MTNNEKYYYRTSFTIQGIFWLALYRIPYVGLIVKSKDKKISGAKLGTGYLYINYVT